MPETQRDTRKRHGLTFWLWIVFGTVLFLLAAPFLIGAFLPSEYVGRAQAEFRSSREELWQAIQDHERYPLSAGLARDVRSVHDDEGLPVWLEEQRNTTLKVTTLETEPPARVVRQVDDGGSPLSCRWEIGISESGEGSRVTVVQRCEIQGGRLGAPHLRFIMRFLGGATMGPRSYLRRLGEGLGEGVEVQ